MCPFSNLVIWATSQQLRLLATLLAASQQFEPEINIFSQQPEAELKNWVA